MSFYQAPETYVMEFVDEIIDELKKKVVIKSVYDQMKSKGIQLTADYGIENIVVEAEAPCNRGRGKDQLERYMNTLNFNIGVLVDIPIERYYHEYPEPCRGNVGFEIYVRLGSSIQQVYVREFALNPAKEQPIIELAHNEFRAIIELLSKLRFTTLIAKVKPTPEYILSKTSEIVKKHSKDIRELLKDGDRVRTYYRLWVRTMELVYGREVLDSVKDLEELFTRLTIYVTVLKSLGATILEAVLGGGRYTIPIRLYIEGHKSAVDLFWYREALARFNVNYLFERDEHDWVFDPQVAHKLDQFFKDIGEFLLSIDWSHGVELDLLKRVYQNIVPRDVRRQLGEYYTPDWIVQLILWRALHILTRGSPPTTPLKDQKDLEQDMAEAIDEFYKRNKRVPRFIDPTCGSFTFGIHYINAVLKWYELKRPDINSIKSAEHIMENVVGIDLNPVAVVTAKVNYLLQIYRLLSIQGNFLATQPIIPILRLDLLLYYIHYSMLRRDTHSAPMDIWLGKVEDKITLQIPLEMLDIEVNGKRINDLKSHGITVKEVKVKSEEESVENVHFVELQLPQSILEKPNTTFTSLTRALMALFNFGVEGYENEVGFKLDVKERELLDKFRLSILRLEELGFDSIWHTFITNYVLALYAARRKFDLVLGNLPWVNVSKYPKGYAKLVRDVIKGLGVSPPREATKKLDMSILLFAIALKYLAEKPSITALMVPTSILRGLHGAGWRKLLKSEPYRVVEMWNLEDVKPFEGAKNQPGIVFVTKG